VGTHKRDGSPRRTDIRVLIVSDAGDWNRAEVGDGYRTDVHVYCREWCCRGVYARLGERSVATTVHVARWRRSTRDTYCAPEGPLG